MTATFYLDGPGTPHMNGTCAYRIRYTDGRPGVVGAAELRLTDSQAAELRAALAGDGS